MSALDRHAAVEGVDLAVGLVDLAATTAVRTLGPGVRVLTPLVRRLLASQPVLHRLALRGRRQRAAQTAALGSQLRALLPAVVEAVLAELDLTRLVAEHVDLDALARRLDLDAAVARVDLDAAVARVDLDAAVARVDLDRLVDRVPIDRVLARVDVDEVAGRLDLDAVLARVDLIGLARYVIDGVDLPEIVRDSTGSMASEGLREVRLQTIDADERVNRLVDRVLLRRQARRTEVGHGPDDEGVP